MYILDIAYIPKRVDMMGIKINIQRADGLKVLWGSESILFISVYRDNGFYLDI